MGDFLGRDECGVGCDSILSAVVAYISVEAGRSTEYSDDVYSESWSGVDGAFYCTKVGR